MRIVGGTWRGRTLIAPSGAGTRPTADRARQALFDMLMHATWGGRAVIEGALVLDVFAGTGALGLEALSRGAASAMFIEFDPAAVRVLRKNIAACGALDRTRVLAVDVLDVATKHGLSSTPAGVGRVPQHPERASVMPDPGARGDWKRGGGASLVFLDPPYAKDLLPRAMSRLLMAGYIAVDALVIAETGRDETWVPEQPVLAERRYGAARLLVFRAG